MLAVRTPSKSLKRKGREGREDGAAAWEESRRAPGGRLDVGRRGRERQKP